METPGDLAWHQGGLTKHVGMDGFPDHKGTLMPNTAEQIREVKLLCPKTYRLQSMDETGLKQACPGAPCSQVVYRSGRKLTIPLVFGDWHGTLGSDRPCPLPVQYTVIYGVRISLAQTPIGILTATNHPLLLLPLATLRPVSQHILPQFSRRSLWELVQHFHLLRDHESGDTTLILRPINYLLARQ
jgi:hypothetical protein